VGGCGEGACVAVSGWATPPPTAAEGTRGASWTAWAVADGAGAAEADEGEATGPWVVLAGAACGAAAAGRPDPSVSVSAIPRPATARTAVRTAMPDRKLIASRRAFTRRLSRPVQPLPLLTTKHGTWVSGVLVGCR
jgi:hypothetical protein